MAASTNQAKAQFILLYGISLVLIFIVVSAFFNKPADPAVAQEAEANAAALQSLNQQVTELKALMAQKDERIKTLESTPAAGLAGGADEKDQMILSLQTQLQEKETALQSLRQQPQASGSGDGEWKQKYAALKAGYDKAVASEKALRSAFKTVAEDNKRLLNQLQSLRAEKN